MNDKELETKPVLAHYSKLSFKRSLIMATTAFLGAATVLTTTAIDANAQESAAVEGRQFGSKAGGVVNEALQMLNSNQYGAALGKLNEAINIPELNPYERSTIYQMMGSAYYEQDQYGQAISAFQNSINAGGLLPKEADSLRVNIAQLMIANGQYTEGASALENYINNGGTQKPEYVEMLTQAWVQADNYQRALPWAEKWFQQANPKERKHYDLLNFLYNNLNMPGRQADIIKDMINRWPEDATLWQNWASLLANGGREEEAFEVNKMLYLGGAMTSEQDLMKIVQYYSFYDMPFQAAEILEKEMNAGRISRSKEKLVQLSDLFRQAREYKRAIPIIEQAASQSGDAKLFADLGEAYYNEGNCAKSEDAFKNAINRGYDAGKSWMLIGTCRYEDAQDEPRAVCKETTKEQRAASVKNQKRERAIEAFNQVPASSREGPNARKWVSFIQAERQAVEDRCEFEVNVEKELCIIKIRQAYDAQVFTGKFELEDNCAAFKPEFDKLYRQKVAAQ